MTALSEALVAAQRRAIGALEKAYLDGRMIRDDFVAFCESFGATDVVDRDNMLSALDVIARFGAALPSENGATADAPPALATDKQKALIVKLLNEQQHPIMASQDLNVMPKERAHQIIDALLAGTYDPATMDVPF